MAGNSSVAAVLTGDIVRSADLTPDQLHQVRQTVLDASESLRHWKRGLVSGRAEFFRGDAWQLLLTRPGLALRSAVFIRASLRGATGRDSRVALGIGTVEHVNTRRVSLSSGEAFVLSGHALDAMTGYSSMTAAAPDRAGATGAWLPLICELSDALLRQWTQRQAQIAAVAATPKSLKAVNHGIVASERTHEQIAEQLVPPVAKQTVSRSLQGASWHALQSALHQVEAVAWTSLAANRGGRDRR